MLCTRIMNYFCLAVISKQGLRPFSGYFRFKLFFQAFMDWTMKIGLFFRPDNLESARDIAFCLRGLCIVVPWYIIVSIKTHFQTHFD